MIKLACANLEQMFDIIISRQGDFTALEPNLRHSATYILSEPHGSPLLTLRPEASRRLLFVVETVHPGEVFADENDVSHG